jgi:Bacterial PH domain
MISRQTLSVDQVYMANINTTYVLLPLIAVVVGLLMFELNPVEVSEFNRIQYLLIHFGPLLIVLFGIYELASRFASSLTTKIEINSNRIFAKWRLLQTSTFDQLLSKIESATTNQGVFGRISNFGMIVVSGTGSTKLVLQGVSEPNTFITEIQRRVDKANFNQTIERSAQ